MNAVYSWVLDRGLAAGPLESVLARITLVLMFAWLAHAAFARANPRWRVLTWRLAAVAVLLVPAVTFWGPALSLAIVPPTGSSRIMEPTAPPADFQHMPPEEDLHTGIQFLPESEPPMSDIRPAERPVASQSSVEANRPAETTIAMILVRFALVTWVIGVAIGLFGEFAAWTKLRTLRRRSRPVSPDVGALARMIAMQVGFRGQVDVRQSSDVASPCVCGLLRPVILVSEIDCLPENQRSLPAILSHESAHLAGGDLYWDFGLRGLSRLLWFHPLIWRARWAHLSACDAVCDATAASLIGDVIGYGKVLAQLAMRLATSNTVPAVQMARPSSVRRRIETLHRRVYSARLSDVTVTASIAVSLLLTGLCGSLSIGRITAAAAEEPRLSVSGQVLNEKAEPIEAARVYVYSAGVRVGTSPFCPTCYADCGKHATTGADGRFTISGLDSTLVFRLLAVADGHRPQFVDKVDPQKDASATVKLTVRAIPDDVTRVVRGQIIGPSGRPAAGAVVEPFGCKTAEKRWWGRMDGVDPLVVTDERGEFVVVCDDPVLGLDLKVESRGAVKKNFELVQSGAEKQRLELEAGTMVTGRVLDRGVPLTGISIGICQVNRSAGTFLGPYQIDTDDKGRFTLPNLPIDGQLVVYGIMKSLKGGLAVVAKKFTPASSEVTDVGDLSVARGHTLRGRLVLADRKPIPPHTRVMFSRQEAWDSNFVEAAADGTFSINGIPPEVISVNVQIKGYRLSPKNKSFEPLNGFAIQGLVADDMEDLTILYEPGETIRPDYNRDFQVAAEKHKRLRTQPLAGVTPTLEAFPADKVTPRTSADPARKPLPKITAPPKESPPLRESGGATKTVTGTVVDSQLQQSRQARVWLPVQWLNPFESLRATGECDGLRPFQLTFPESWLPVEPKLRHPIVWAYAKGFAIGTGNAQKQMFGNEPAEPFKIELPPSGDLSYVVLLPDGTPAVGAKVKPSHFKTQRGYEPLPAELAELVAGITDQAGRVAIPALTREGVFTNHVTLAGYGKQEFRCDIKSTDPAEQTLQLRPVGRIEGRIAVDQLDLVRDMFVSVETTALSRGNPRGATGVGIVKVDDEGKFVIPEIADGRVEVSARCDERLPVRARLPETGTLTLLTGETATVEIPLEMAVRVHGLVRAKDSGKPLGGVKVAVRYGVGIQGDHALTNETGEYSAFALSGDVYVHLISAPKGYLQLGEPWKERRKVPADAVEYAWPPIEVVPSTTVSGKLLDRDGKPMANVRINGGVGNRRYGFGNTDANGIFRLSDVPTEIQLETFEIWTRDEHFRGVVDTKDPLVVRVEKSL